MTAQDDLFAGDELAVRSFPPHLDPAKVKDWRVVPVTDADFVAPAVAGVLPVGAIGNNREVWALETIGANDEILHCEKFTTRSAAWAEQQRAENSIRLNRQLVML